MKDVISYRTPYLDELKKIAKIRNVSLSTITGEIIQDYLHKHQIIKKYDLFHDGRKFLSVAFENIDSENFDKIAEAGANEYAQGAKMSTNDFSLENLLVYFREWIDINNLQLGEFDENDRVRWVVRTNMGQKYNEISANIDKKVLERFGFRCNIESFSDENYELLFLKTKNK